MELAAVHRVNEALSGDTSAFLYSGSFHDEHTAQLISMGEQLVAQVNGERTLRNKVGFLMVESYQNIIRHRIRLSADLERHAGRSMFLLRQRGLSFEVVAVNAIPNEEVAPLKLLLENVSHLDPKQLKKMFLDGLQNDSRSRKGGAGLGLIEMARRSGHDLLHHMVPVGADHHRYALRVLIGNKELQQCSGKEVDDLHKLVADQDILLLCKGRYTDDLHRTVVEMISKDLDDGDPRSEMWTKCYLAATELMKTVGKANAESLILIGRTELGHSFVAGTEMDPIKAAQLEQKIAMLNGLNGDQLQQSYDDVLIGKHQDGDIQSLGLLDLARRKVAPMQIRRTPKNGSEFVVMEVIV